MARVFFRSVLEVSHAARVFFRSVLEAGRVAWVFPRSLLRQNCEGAVAGTVIARELARKSPIGDKRGI